MDKQHREELDQNDLESFLFSLNEWWEKNGLRFLTTVLIAAVIYLAWTWYNNSRIRAHQEAWQNLETSTSPESLRDVAQTTSNPDVAALAYLRGGDLALAKATLPSPPAPMQQLSQDAPPPEPPVTPDERKRLLDDAEMMYKEVAQKADAPQLLKLNAMMGLAAVDESRSDWSGAGALYKQVIDDAGTFEVLKAKAQAHLAILDRLATPVPFAPEPAPPKADLLSHPMAPAATQPAGGKR